MPFLDLYKDYVRRYANYIRKAHVAFPPESFQPAEALLNQAYNEARNDPSPGTPVSPVFVTTSVLGTSRCSRFSRAGRNGQSRGARVGRPAFSAAKTSCAREDGGVHLLANSSTALTSSAMGLDSGSILSGVNSPMLSGVTRLVPLGGQNPSAIATI